MLLYLDNCCFNRPFDDQSQISVKLETEAKLSIQEQIVDGEHDLVWSYILEFENNQNPNLERQFSIREWKTVSRHNVIATDTIVRNAEKYVSLGLKPKDALHVACAVSAGAQVFLTTDKGIISKMISDIVIMNPIDFVRE